MNKIFLWSAYCFLFMGGTLGAAFAQDDGAQPMADEMAPPVMEDTIASEGDAPVSSPGAAEMAAIDANSANASSANEPTPAPDASAGESTNNQGTMSNRSPCGRNGARRCSLNNNILIEDHDDVFMFPQKAHSKYNANRVRLDTDGTQSQGTFFSRIGKDGGWGLAVSHAQAQQSSQIGLKSARTTETAVPAQQVLDAFYSGGGKNAWGVRLSVGSGGQVGDEPNETSNINFAIAGGYSTKGKVQMDLGARLHYAGITVENEGEAQIIDFVGHFRGYMKGFQKSIDMGLIGEVSYRGRAHVAESNQIDDESDTQIGVKVGAGPVFRLDKSTVSTYALINLRHLSDTNSEDTGYRVAIPEVNIAFETPINDWLTFRSGVGYSFVVMNETPGDSNADATGRKTNVFGDEMVDQGGATSAIGLGAQWEKLTVDMAINKSWLTNGPYFLTGHATPDPWAAKAAVSYNW